MQDNHYFDLTDSTNDIDSLSINRDGHFNCSLVNPTTGEVYKGFILAKSPQGNKLTLCDVDFQRSSTDDKYQPRLTFRRTDSQLEDTRLRSNADHIRMPFQGGEDGYRELWKMIFFLYKFKETVDFGDFEEQYQVLTSQQLKEYLNNKENHEKIIEAAKELDTDVSGILRSSATLKLLREYRDKLKEFIENESSETDVQNWIDEEEGKHRQQRCLIFGLEYIDFQREGSTSSKKFDVLTRVGSKYIDHVLIELKSPSDDLFDITTRQTTNGPTHDYKIHKELARAIPQILEYKSSLENKNAGDSELEKLGIKGQAHIGKCIIIIGKHSDDDRWQVNRKNLVKSLSSSLEIWTYTELLNKLENTIENLEPHSEEF